MSSTNLKSLRQLAEAATKISGYEPQPLSEAGSWFDLVGPNGEQVGEVILEQDAEYIAAASPDVILELLDLLEEARKQIKHCTLTHRPHYFALEEIYGVWQEKRDFLARLNQKLSQ